MYHFSPFCFSGHWVLERILPRNQNVAAKMFFYRGDKLNDGKLFMIDSCTFDKRTNQILALGRYVFVSSLVWYHVEKVVRIQMFLVLFDFRQGNKTVLFSYTIYRDGGRPYNLIKLQNDKNIDVGNDGLALQDGLIFSLGKFTCFLEVSCNSR